MAKQAAALASQRIPGKTVGNCQAWQLPEVSGEVVVYSTSSADAEPKTLASQLTAFTAQGNVSPTKLTTRTRLTGSELEKLIADAEAEAQAQGFQQGLEEGRAAGHAEGVQQGLQAASDQFATLNATVDAISEQLPAALAVHNETVQQSLVELIGKLSSAVVQQELSVSQASLEKVIATALAAVSATDKALTVFVSEQDYVLLTQAERVATDWRLEKDPALSNGDCRVITQHAAIDYTVTERLEQALAALYASFASTPEPDVTIDS